MVPGNCAFTTVSGGGGGGGATTLITGLTDVSSTAPNAGEVLKWTGSAWARGVDNTGTTIFNPLNDIGNVDTTGVANGSVLKYNQLQVLGKLALIIQVCKFNRYRRFSRRFN